MSSGLIGHLARMQTLLFLYYSFVVTTVQHKVLITTESTAVGSLIVFLSSVLYLSNSVTNTRGQVLMLFESYLPKSLTSDRGENLTIANNP